MEAVFKQKAIVLAVNPYNFITDDKREMSGVSMEYLLTDNLNPRIDGSMKGIKTGKESLPLDKQNKFGPVPALYELSFAMRTGQKGKMQLKAVDADFIAEVTLVIGPPCENVAT